VNVAEAIRCPASSRHRVSGSTRALAATVPASTSTAGGTSRDRVRVIDVRGRTRPLRRIWPVRLCTTKKPLRARNTSTPPDTRPVVTW
jgi:hypothetical protein